MSICSPLNPMIFSKALTLMQTSLISSGVALSIVLGYSARSIAQVSLSPMTIQVSAKRGQASGFITVSNPTDQAFRAKVYAEAFTYEAEKGFKTLTAEAAGQSNLIPYLQFSPQDLIVPPKSTRRVRLITRLPANAPKGEYRAVIFTESLQEKQEVLDNKQGMLNLRTRIGSTFYVYNGEISPAKVKIDSIQWHEGKQAFQVKLKNEGEVTERAFINWQLKKNNTIVHSGEVLPAGIIPQGERKVLLTPQITEGRMTSPLSPGRYQLVGTLSWGEAIREQPSENFTLEVEVPGASATATPAAK